MKRALILAAAGLCVTMAAHAQGVSQKYDWNDADNRSCMAPYAPAVPKAEDTSLKELLEEVKPEVQTFIDDSNKYLECLAVQMQKAREEEDEEKIKKLVKAHNDNVEYQQSVAGEFNATLKTLKEDAGLAVTSEKAGEDGEAAEGAEAESSEEDEQESAENAKKEEESN